MKYFSLTQLVDNCITNVPGCEAVQICVNTKHGKLNQFGQQQIQPAILKIINQGKPQTFTYNEYSDKYLSGEDWMVSLKFPKQVISEEWCVVILDTVKRTCDAIQGHYYSKAFRKLDANAVERAEKAENQIKSIQEVQFDLEPIYF
jgi:hypothetical protein